ncbi:MAG: ATP-binding cassette domain-containing protein [Myxococcota bacterium]
MLRARDLCVERYGREVLRDISLAVARGTVGAVIGPPRSGKSTLLRALAALVLPTRGTIALGDTLLETSTVEGVRRWQQHIGMAFQNDALFDDATVFDNVALPLRHRGLAPGRVTELVEARLADVGLLDARAKTPDMLSGGMRKRVGVARATVHTPALGLFDDPIAGLDPLSGSRILELIVRLTREHHMAAVVVSHDLDVLLPVAARVTVLVAGECAFDGEPAELATSTRADVRQFVTGSDVGPL